MKVNSSRIAKCGSCNKYTLQQRTIFTPTTNALLIPEILGEERVLCYGDIYVWYCLQCNNWQENRK